MKRNASGQLVRDNCCCGCDLCGKLSNRLSVVLGANYNLSGTCPDCGNWQATWTLARLTAVELAAYEAAYGHADFSGAVIPCVYATTAGLPCGCDLMLAAKNNAADQTNPEWFVLFVWGTQYVRLNLKLLCGGTLATAQNTSGIETNGGTPCDFFALVFTPALFNTITLQML